MLRDNVKKLRKAKGWTQQQLAQKAGIVFSVLTKIEQGATKDPGLSTVMALAGALGIGLDELTGFKPNPVKDKKKSQ